MTAASEHRLPWLRDRSRMPNDATAFAASLSMIVLGQAIWLGVLMSRGWYYQADLANLAEATGRPLDWAYLSGAQGGHFAIPGRFLFWVLNRVAPLNYSATVAIRLVGQAACTALLARLLMLLVGRRRVVLLTLGLYALSPFLVQGTLWLSSSFGLIGSQLCLTGALISHVRYAVSRRIAHAIAVAALLVCATLLSEEAAITSLALPLMSFFFLASGGLFDRMRQVGAAWREWALIAAPMVGYVAYYFSGAAGYGTAAHPLTADDAARVVRVHLTQTIAPGLIGGPWHWFATDGNYLGLSDPSIVIQAICVASLVVLLAVAIHAWGWRPLAAWSIPLLIASVGIVVVAVGRYDAFGVVIAQQFEHGYFVALPAAVALCLSMHRVDIDSVRARLTHEAASTELSLPRRHRAHSIVLVSLVVALVVSSVFSGVTYTQIWARSPAHSYVSALSRDVGAAGGSAVSLYDTAVPAVIIPLEARHYVSDVLGLTGTGANFTYDAPQPRIIDPRGQVVAARFFVQTDVNLTGPQFCRFPVQGVTAVTRPFRAQARRNDWYLEISYFEQHASVVRVSLIDGDGTDHRPVLRNRAINREILNRGPGRIHLLFRASAPVSVRVRSASPATNLCITDARLGFPYATPRASQ
jgi:hypothetical protein